MKSPFAFLRRPIHTSQGNLQQHTFTMAHVRPYNPKVRVGNWFEDLALEEQQMMDFLKKRETGELAFQKAAQLGDTTKVEISASGTGEVGASGNTGGNTVQLQCEGNGKMLATSFEIEDETVIGQLTATDNCSPVTRNTFTIEPFDTTQKGPILYGQPVVLQCKSYDENNEPFDAYVCSDLKPPMQIFTKSRHQIYGFTRERSANTKFVFLHKNPQVRMEFEGQPVKANCPCLILHVNTGRGMFLEEESDDTERTKYGVETLVNCYTSLDRFKAESPYNRWCIVTKQNYVHTMSN